MLNDAHGQDSQGHDSQGHDSQDVAQLRKQIDDVERTAAKKVELGRRGFGIAVLVFILLVTLLLPWADGYAGWEALLGEVGILPQLFASTLVAFCIVASAVTLITRLWWLAWVCAVGACVSSVDGMFAIWKQQSTAAPGVAGDGPGLGMGIAFVAVIVLAINWVRVAGSRR